MFTNISSSHGIDLLERLQADAALDPDGPSQALLEDASRRPPEDIAASPRQIQEARAFFLDHSIAIIQCLMSFSLAGGFARQAPSFEAMPFLNMNRHTIQPSNSSSAAIGLLLGSPA